MSRRSALVVLAIATVVLCATLALRLHRRAVFAEGFFADLLGWAEEIDPAILFSQEASIGADGGLSAAGVGLHLGDALVRWQVAKRSPLAVSEQVRDVAGELEYWLGRTDLRGSGRGWASALAATPEADDPSPRALRSLRRSLPDGSVEAGRWLAAIRLWPQRRLVEFGPEQRQTAMQVFGAARLLQVADPRLSRLLDQDRLSNADLLELRGLATELLLAGR